MTGNWSDFLQKTSGSTDLNQDRTHNPVNEITGITETVGTAWIDPVHDRAGNMTTLPKPSSPATGLTCTWDAWNRLVEVKEGATVVGRYEYDGLGRRVKSHVDSQSPGNPNGVDAYVHFFYNSGLAGARVARVGQREHAARVAAAAVPVRLVAAVHRRARAAGQEHGCRWAV